VKYLLPFRISKQHSRQHACIPPSYFLVFDMKITRLVFIYTFQHNTNIEEQTKPVLLYHNPGYKILMPRQSFRPIYVHHPRRRLFQKATEYHPWHQIPRSLITVSWHLVPFRAVTSALRVHSYFWQPALRNLGTKSVSSLPLAVTLIPLSAMPFFTDKLLRKYLYKVILWLAQAWEPL
jgi:hypothetical protein